MKVAVVSPNRDKYSETFIRTHVERLPAELGETMHLHGDVLPLWQDEGRRLPPRTLHLAGAMAEAMFEKEKEEVTSFLARQLPNRFRERAIARHLRRTDIDVVLAEFGHTGVAMNPVTQRAGIPLVVHFHGYDAYKQQMLDDYADDYEALLQSAEAVIAVSRDMVGQLESLGADRSCIHLNPCGIDVDRFRPGDVSSSDPELLAVGRFVEKKAPYLTILAFARAASSHPEATLTMAGDGPLLDACRTLATALELDDRIDFLGSVSHERVRSLMKRSRAFVQHSLRPPSGDSEGNPVAVREAMASGLPVVATGHAGIKDSVVDGETGFLVAEHDWRSMADHMNQILENSSLAARLGEAGRSKAKDEFQTTDLINQLARVLKKVARNR